jgi:carboxyl-terminal processing protease
LNSMIAKRKPERQEVYLIVLGVLILIAVFYFGLNVGNGRLRVPVIGATPVSGNLPSSLNYTSVNQVYQALKNNYDGKLTETQLENGLKHGLAEATDDPYTVYFTASEAKSFNDELNNAFSGIGAELGANSSGDLEVIAPVAGTPAAKAGLKAQDLIVRGRAGTKITLGVVRGGGQSLNFTITRANLTVPSVTTKTLPGNIGYMGISTFADDTSSLAQKAADQFKQENVKGIILDLRDNPGGEVTAAQSVSSLWLKQGQTILQEKRGNDVIETDYASGNDELHGIPTVVLIDGGSASASEITAGALHDNGDAYLIGQKSFGKGVVQQLINFNDGSQLKVTIASWYRPDGQDIEHKGITPDKTVVEPSSASASNDPQLQAAETYLSTH